MTETPRRTSSVRDSLRSDGRPPRHASHAPSSVDATRKRAHVIVTASTTPTRIFSGIGRLPHMKTVISVSTRPNCQRPVVLCMDCPSRRAKAAERGMIQSFRLVPSGAVLARAGSLVYHEARPGSRGARMTTEETTRYVSRFTQGTLALVLAGGRGARLKHLTLQRAKPATPFGGKFRIIDFPLSNCVNSGIRRMCVLTQYKAHQLILHIQRGWSFLAGRFNEFVELLPAQQRVDGSWYQGTADAVFQNLDIIRGHKPEHVLILAGDHIYKMDYGPMIVHHVEHGADITVGCIEVPGDREIGRASGRE